MLQFIILLLCIVTPLGSAKSISQFKCGAVCAIYCEYGNVLDEHGCPTCKCKEKPTCDDLVCDIKCEYGNVLDEHDCPTCQCKEKPVCGPVCHIYCKFGHVLDENGCPTCKCKETPTCGPVCAIYCEYGNVLDKNGCPTCSCRKSPCKDEQTSYPNINCGRSLNRKDCPSNYECIISDVDAYAVCCPINQESTIRPQY